METQVKSIFDVGPVEGGIFVDNLMVCSADRLLFTHYRYIKDDVIESKPGVAAALFSHDLLNLSSLVESIVCHDNIFINAEYIDRWNSNIQESTLRPLNEILIPLSWPQSQREEAENRLREVLPSISRDSGLERLAEIVFEATHHVFSDYHGRSLEQRHFLPYDEGRPWGTPFYIVMGTAFYLMCSQVIGIPYKPSVIRAQLLSDLIHREIRSQQFSVAEIAISLLEKSREKVAEEYFNKILEFNVIETHLPCVLSAVLKEAKSPADVILIAKQMRDNDNAKAFRAWSREFSSTIQKGDLVKIGEFIKELQGVVERINEFLGLKSDESTGVSIGWGPISIGPFSLPRALKRPIYFKRHLWFLHNMYSGIVTMARLSGHIERVIVRSLPKWFQRVISSQIDWHYIQSIGLEGKNMANK